MIRFRPTNSHTAPRLMAAATFFALQSASHAQDAPETTAPAVKATTNAAEAARINKRLSKATAAYKNLKSYSGRFEFSGTPAGEVPRERGTLIFQRPNRIAMRIEHKDYARRIVSDGKFVYVSDSRFKGKYSKRALPIGGDLISQLIDESQNSLFLPLLMNGYSERKFNVPEKVGTVRIVSPENSPTFSLQLVGKSPEELGTTTMNFVFDPNDGLLRTMTYSGVTEQESVRIQETHSDIQINSALPVSTFVFTPAPGAKAVESFEPTATPPFIEPATYDERLKVGAKPFAIKTRDWKGQPISLDAYKGKVVLIDFWATWCPPCREEMPNVIAAYNAHKKSGFDVLGVSLDQDKKALAEYVTQNKMPWRQIFDGKGWKSAIGASYGVQAIPFSLLIGRDGRIVAVNPRGDELEPAVRAALRK